jgi:hypothetical protein
MFFQGTPSRFSIFMAFLTFCIAFLLGLSDLLAQSSCVSCHTKENMLKKSLVSKEEKKSALTSGAG